ncbi:hypothetical protein [Flavisericum labens]|uniref:hypothetical protein n=1 Tax=Flavisericum labens TaxID=3377112 RepID=UPI00387B58C5
MKYHFIKALTVFLLLTNCSLNNNNKDESREITVVFWHLTNTTGGLAGVDNQFSQDTVVWNFNDVNGTLNVQNRNTDDTKQSGLESGLFNFSLIAKGSEDFLVVNGNELGKITVEDSTFILNENHTSQGEIADGFIYTFKKVTQIIEI